MPVVSGCLDCSCVFGYTGNINLHLIKNPLSASGNTVFETEAGAKQIIPSLIAAAHKMNEIHVRESIKIEEVPRVKPIPKNSAIPVPFTYIPSDDGTDENLLIILHGLGNYLRRPESPRIDIHIIRFQQATRTSRLPKWGGN
jgi:hypothetical protein